MAHLHRLPALLLAIALLAAAALPMAAPADPPLPPPPAAESAEAAPEEEELEEECVVVETELVDGELQEFCEEEDESEAASSAERCFLRSAHAHSSTRRHRLTVAVGYTTYAPASARIVIRQGAIRIGAFNRHLGRSGVLRFTSKLDQHGRGRVSVRISPAARTECPSRQLVLRAD